MTRLALIKLSDKSVVTAPIAEGSIVELPGIGFVSPAQAGWTGGGKLMYIQPPDGPEVAEEGPAQYGLVPIVDFVVPEGKQTVGLAVYRLNGGVVTETFEVEDTPAPTELTPAEKLANAGLTVDDLKTLLGIS